MSRLTSDLTFGFHMYPSFRLTSKICHVLKENIAKREKKVIINYHTDNYVRYIKGK